MASEHTGDNGEWTREEANRNVCLVINIGSQTIFQVEYVTRENAVRPAEAVNMTHPELVPNSEKHFGEDDRSFIYSLELDGDLAHLTVSESDVDEMTINQDLSETTCFQLADMFRRAGSLLRIERTSRERREQENKPKEQKAPSLDGGLFG